MNHEYEVLAGQGKVLVGYVTDIEGNYDYWTKYLNISKVVSRSSTTNKLELKENCQFVYGGDVCDRGNGDIRILKDLVGLKKAYPDRVHFILGNRDVNKLRLPISLHKSALAYPPQCYWVKTDLQAQDPLYQFNEMNCKMKWILKQTMGSPLSFECRRQELTEMRLPHTDDDITQSYLRLILPAHTKRISREAGLETDGQEDDGLLLQYLMLGVMGVVIEDTIFVHGGLVEYYLGWVPPAPVPLTGKITQATLKQHNAENSTVCTNPVEWLEKMNTFVKQEVQSYKENLFTYLTAMYTNCPPPVHTPHHGLSGSSSRSAPVFEWMWDCVGGYGHAQPGSGLIQVGMGSLPDNSRNPTVIYCSYLQDGKPVVLSEKVAQWCKSEGIYRIMVGHQPNGDAPFIMDHLSSQVQVISADSSYSRFTQYPSTDLPVLHALATTGQLPVTTTTNNNTASEDDASTPAEVWMSYEKYLTTLPVEDSDNEVVKPPPTAAEKANTRSIYQVNEVVIIYDHVPLVRGLPSTLTGTDLADSPASSPGLGPRAGTVRTGGFSSPARQRNTTNGSPTAMGHNTGIGMSSVGIGNSVLQPPRMHRSAVLVHGRLSCGGLPYRNYLLPTTTLPTTTTGMETTSGHATVGHPTASSKESAVSTAFVGKRTSGNWYVKVAPLLMSTTGTSTATTNTNSRRRPSSGTRSLLSAPGVGPVDNVEEQQQQGYAVLAYSEGFDFKARLMSLSDLSTESFY